MVLVDYEARILHAVVRLLFLLMLFVIRKIIVLDIELAIMHILLILLVCHNLHVLSSITRR